MKNLVNFLGRISAVGIIIYPALYIAIVPSQAMVLNDIAADYFGGIENYWDYNNSFPTVVSLYIEGESLKGSNCSGTLVNSRTVLTAAHCLTGLDPDKMNLSIRFSPDAHNKTIHDRGMNGLIVHEAFRERAYLSDNDIALVTLASPVTGIVPLHNYSSSVSRGDLLIFAGYGLAGTGSSPAQINDGKRRVGEALFEWIFYNLDRCSVGCISSYLYDPLHPNADKSPSDIPFLEAGLAPGDSGGPLFIRREDGQYSLIGIARFISGFGYGMVNVWTPLFPFFEWINENNPLQITSSMPGTYKWSNEEAWRTTQGRSEIPNNSDGSLYSLYTPGRYYEVKIADSSSVTLDINAAIDGLNIDKGAKLEIAPDYTLNVVSSIGLHGMLTVDGKISTGSLLISGGILGGNGAIAASDAVLNSGGIVVPGRFEDVGRITPGVLKIQGDYAQLNNGTLISALSAGGAGRLDVEGSAYIQGRLHIAGAPSHFNPQSSYRVVTVTEGLYGKFGAVTKDLFFLSPVVTYDDRGISFRLERNSTPFSAFADSLNGYAAAHAFETVTMENGAYRALIKSHAYSPNVQSLETAFSLLSGEVHASAVSVVYGDANAVRDAVLQHMRTPQMLAAKPVEANDKNTFAGNDGERQLHSGSEAKRDTYDLDPQRFAMWGSGVGAWGQWRGNARNQTLDTSGSGFLIGAEVKPYQDMRLGIAGGYIRTSLEIESRLSSGSNASGFGAMYGDGKIGNWQIRLGAAYMHNHIETQRSVILPGYSDAPSSLRNSSVVQAFGELGYGVDISKNVYIEPFISASAFRVNAERFTEYGRDAALSSFGRHYDVATAMFALRGETRLENVVPMTLRALIGWRSAFGDIRPEAKLAFASGSDAFLVSGAPIDRNAFVVDAGFDMQIAQDVMVGMSAGGQFGTHAQSQHLKGNLVWRF